MNKDTDSQKIPISEQIQMARAMRRNGIDPLSFLVGLYKIVKRFPLQKHSIDSSHEAWSRAQTQIANDRFMAGLHATSTATKPETDFFEMLREVERSLPDVAHSSSKLPPKPKRQ